MSRWEGGAAGRRWPRRGPVDFAERADPSPRSGPTNDGRTRTAGRRWPRERGVAEPGRRWPRGRSAAEGER